MCHCDHFNSISTQYLINDKYFVGFCISITEFKVTADLSYCYYNNVQFSHMQAKSGESEHAVYTVKITTYAMLMSLIH